MALETKTEFVSISETAFEQIQNVIAQQEHGNLFLRIFVQGGCGGVSYGMAIDMKQQPDDAEFFINDLKVVVDRISYPYIDGATVDFDASGEKKGFRISNPNAAELFSQAGGCCGGASQTAGCGGGACGAGGGGCC